VRTTSIAISRRKSRAGVAKSSHAPVVSKIVAPFERIIAVLWIFRDLGVGQPLQGAVLVAHDRPKALEPGATERGWLRLMRPLPLGPRSRNWVIASGVIGVCFSAERTLLPLRTASTVLKVTASAEFGAL
jgi:hypothetical protein